MKKYDYKKLKGKKANEKKAKVTNGLKKKQKKYIEELFGEIEDKKT